MAKKRANGEGSIHRLPSGSWQTQIMDGYKPDGTRKFKTITAPTQSALKKQKLEYDKKKSDGTLSDKEYTFAEWAVIWFEHHKNTISATTQEGYKYTLRILHDYFGHRKLADIFSIEGLQHPNILGRGGDDLVHQLCRGVLQNDASDSQITKLRGMLCQIFNKAVANDLVVKNPAAHLDKMKRAPKKPRESFTRDEVDKMMKELPDNKIGWSIRLLLFTGMRPGEILGLEPRHIAKDGSWINIEQATVKVKGTTEIGPPKTVDSYRTVPVPELVRYCARNLRNTDKKFIWDSPKKPGHPCNESYFRTLFANRYSWYLVSHYLPLPILHL